MPIKLSKLKELVPLDVIDMGDGDTLNVWCRKPTPATLDTIRAGLKESGESLEQQLRVNLLSVVAKWDILDGDGNEQPVNEEILSLLDITTQKTIFDRMQSRFFPTEEDAKNAETPSATGT